MQQYQPWDESWRDQIVYIFIPSVVEPPVEMASDFSYPVFIGAFDKKVQGEDFWKAVAGAMVYVIGHQPNHPFAVSYIYWLNKYDSTIVDGLIYDGADQASKENLDTAIWLLQAAVLLSPDKAEAHYNLGSAFYEEGMRLLKANDSQNKIKADSCFFQAKQYMENAVEIAPDLSLAYYSLGSIYKRMGKYEAGKRYLEKGIVADLEKCTLDGHRERDSIAD